MRHRPTISTGAPNGTSGTGAPLTLSQPRRCDSFPNHRYPRRVVERSVASRGGQLKHVATLAFSGPGGAGNVTASVQPELVRHGDRLANIDGTTNAVVCEASPVGEIAISGPGAGPQLAGQGGC
jgi:homoserine dehydrogenase